MKRIMLCVIAVCLLSLPVMGEEEQPQPIPPLPFAISLPENLKVSFDASVEGFSYDKSGYHIMVGGINMSVQDVLDLLKTTKDVQWTEYEKACDFKECIYMEGNTTKRMHTAFVLSIEANTTYLITQEINLASYFPYKERIAAVYDSIKPLE